MGPAAALFAAALLLRIATLGVANRMVGEQALGSGPLDLALLFDGHLYLLIARTFPVPYAGVREILPLYAEPAVLTTWFPFYPLWIAAAEPLLGDLRLAALAASQVCGALAVVVFYFLARRWLRAPLLAAGLFAFFPATWLWSSTLVYTEPLLLLLALGSVACFLANRLWSCALLAGLAIVTQKNGFLLLPIFGLWLLREHGAGAFRRGLPLLLALLPPLLLQLHLYFLFGDAFANLRQTRGIYATSFFGLPFQALVTGWLQTSSLDPDFFWLQKAMIALSFLFYAVALGVGWRGRDGAAAFLVLWLGVVLAFNLCLGGHWAYYNFSRFMLLAAPAAILLLLRRFEAVLPRRAALAALALAPVCVWISALAVRSGVHFFLERGTAEYFRIFRERVL